MLTLLKQLDPRPWLIAAIAVAVVFAIVNYQEALHEVDKIKAQAQQDLAQATEHALEKERQLNRSIATLQDHHAKEITDEKLKTSQFIASVKSGAIRLSIPVIARGAACTANPTLASANTETRAELTPEAGATLAAIASEGNQAIIDLNYCIDAYNQVRATYNVQTKQPAPAPD